MGSLGALSPHAKRVWQSQFPSLLLKCMWHAFVAHDFQCHRRSLMQGLGAQANPHKWWHPILWPPFHKSSFHRVVCFKQLLTWVEEGRSH